MKTKNNYLIIFFLLFPLLVKSQQMLDFPTPNAASLGQYGQVPVNLYNGMPQISVPIYDFKYKEINLPISISYHASGIRTDDYPSWIGLGWTLNVGGNISRIVNGMPDEITVQELNEGKMGFQYPTNKEYGFFFRSKDLDNSDWTSNLFLENYFNLLPLNVMPWDGEPDEFLFNVGDLSGSFYMIRKANNELVVKVKSKTGEHLRIEPVVTTGSLQFDIFKGIDIIDVQPPKANVKRTFMSFVITRANGMQYTFGGDINAIDFNTIQNQEVVRTTATNWNLTKIATPKGIQVNFEYKKDGDVFIARKIRQVVCSNLEVAHSCTPDSEQNEWKYSLLHPSYLTKITSERGIEVEFFSSPSNQMSFDWSNNYHKRAFDRIASDDEWHDEFMLSNYLLQLDKIVIPGLHDIKFHYITNPNQRLRLDKLEISNEEINKKYYFEYNSQNLPSYNAKKSDNWGYFNNKYYGGVPNDSLFDFRSSDIKYAKAESLEKIIYPTGGITKFDYELNDYSVVAQQYPSFSLSPQTGIAGGLRIKRITSLSDANEANPQIREYSYKNDNGQSSGVLSGIPKYEAFGRNFVKFKYSEWDGLLYFGANYDFHQDFRMQSESWLSPLGQTNGNHITYSQVIEKRIGNGHTVYLYTNHQDYADLEPLRLFGNIEGEIILNSFTSRGLERGLLKEEKYYDNTNTLIKQVEYKYNSSSNRYDDFIRSLDYFHTSADVGDYVRASTNRIFTFYPYLEKKTIKDYSGNELAETSIKYIYDKTYNKIKEEETLTSKGEHIKTEFKYPFDFLNQQVYEGMIDAHFISPVIEKTVFKNGEVISHIFNDYTKLGSGIFVPQSVEVKTALDAQGTKEIYTYNSLGNLSTSVKENGPKTSYIWGYGREFPIAEVRNAEYTDVVTALGGTLAIDDFNLDSNPSQEVVHSFLSLLYSSPLLENSLITGYTYLPLKGVTSITDSKRQTMYYEYDDFGRLLAVRNSLHELINSYCYNYAGEVINCFEKTNQTIFENKEKSEFFNRSNCLSGYVSGPPVNYVVPEGRYISTLSKEDANQEASLDLITNGPLYANMACQCNKIVYVKLERLTKDIILLDGDEEGDETLYEYRGDLIVSFYSDSEMTLPIDVTDKNLQLVLNIDHAANIYPPISSPFTLLCEGTREILLSDVPLREEHSQRDFDTGQFVVLSFTDYQYSLIQQPSYIIN